MKPKVPELRVKIKYMFTEFFKNDCAPKMLNMNGI